MAEDGGKRGALGLIGAGAAAVGRFTARNVTDAIGGRERTRVVVILACVLGLSGADAATVGASATALREQPRTSRTPTSACSSP